MTNVQTPSSVIVLNDEINRLISLCNHIAQSASNIRNEHLSNISLSTDNIQSSYNALLSTAENIEGSAILLESLLAIQQKNLMSIKTPKSTRIHYTRNQLLELRNHVTTELSDKIGTSLKQIVQYESSDSANRERKSWRDIRTILM